MPCDCCGCCCVDGAIDATSTTQEECAAAGGTWIVKSECNAGKCACYCEDYLNICIEQVYSYYGFTWSAETSAGGSTPDDIPATQPEGTLRVWTETQGDYPAASGCAGTSGIRQNHQNFPGTYCYIADPCNITYGMQAYRTQWYFRARLVADCEDCGSAFTYPFVEEGDPTGCDPPKPETWSGVCAEGAAAVSCVTVTVESCKASEYLPCLGELELDVCLNEFP